MLILSFNLLISIKIHFEEKNDFSIYFWLIFVQAPSENVVAMEAREGLFFKF